MMMIRITGRVQWCFEKYHRAKMPALERMAIVCYAFSLISLITVFVMSSPAKLRHAKFQAPVFHALKMP
jgi:hypothetical protein